MYYPKCDHTDSAGVINCITGFVCTRIYTSSWGDHTILAMIPYDPCELNSHRNTECVCMCKYIHTPHREITPCLQWPHVIRVWSLLSRPSACDGWTDAAQQVKRRGSQPRGRRATQVQTSSTRRHDPDCTFFLATFLALHSAPVTCWNRGHAQGSKQRGTRANFLGDTIQIALLSFIVLFFSRKIVHGYDSSFNFWLLALLLDTDLDRDRVQNQV